MDVTFTFTIHVCLMIHPFSTPPENVVRDFLFGVFDHRILIIDYLQNNRHTIGFLIII